ncbi:hypothetical protein M9458_042214, partial [Cirrhinus mrigala]
TDMLTCPRFSLHRSPLSPLAPVSKSNPKRDSVPKSCHERISVPECSPESLEAHKCPLSHPLLPPPLLSSGSPSAHPQPNIHAVGSPRVCQSPSASCSSLRLVPPVISLAPPGSFLAPPSVVSTLDSVCRPPPEPSPERAPVSTSSPERAPAPKLIPERAHVLMTSPKRAPVPKSSRERASVPKSGPERAAVPMSGQGRAVAATQAQGWLLFPQGY